jgi:hypothetical protein
VPRATARQEQETITGSPDPKHISTSYVERQNLTMRMSRRRFTRLTNAFSKKVENHAAAVALYFMYYNFRPVHQTLRVTPAMEAGVSDHVWSVEESLALLPSQTPIDQPHGRDVNRGDDHVISGMQRALEDGTEPQGVSLEGVCERHK